ncbi:ribosomal protection-like ABC-F family protein [Haloplasma contractile]|uniref:ABC transporter ATP-binding protein uup n=1 Tax=Haloplasma contractile SSD-17B TaxID=1033810 RepID=U2DY19_9MOLU|nr:ABC-F family ATP-binding cassette domain-containing protein [Haloplasma contractile]ERJ13157.1 ABC transporter ATP-binding protein uup [Haloplasma contractile SSD-17B]
MIEIGAHKLKKSFGGNLLFENVSFEIHSGERVGLIGRNGIGKTTLMKLLLGDHYDEGELFLRKGIKLSYLNQIPEYKNHETTMDLLTKAFSAIQIMRKKLTALELEMADVTGDELERILNVYSELQTKFELSGGYDTEEKLGKIITGLNLEHLTELSFDRLSGGEKTRVMLGKVLLEEPDVLLLDEPTNHLDIKMVNWLEDYLQKYDGAVVLISHDRYFLDRVVTKIIELHPDGIEVYKGNYSFYKVEKERRFEEAMKEFKNQQKKIKNMEDQIKRYRIWGNMRDSEKMYKKAKELEKRLSKIDRVEKPTTGATIKLNFEEQNRSGKRVYELNNISKSYNGRNLFDHLNLEVFYQDCLTIIGENGTGKTTLLNIIREEVKPDHGTVKRGSRLKVGYLPQEVVFKDENLTILETYRQYFNCTNGEARYSLAGILFRKEDVFKKINILSGGEKSRLKLLMLMDEKVNVLLLDEPTNHLDIESREILEESLLAFDGTIIVISHDRYFINRLSNRMVELTSNKLMVYNGNYEYYLQEKKKESIKFKQEENTSKKKNEVNKNKANRNKKVLSEQDKEKTLQRIQSEIEKREKDLSNIIEEMNINGSNLNYLQELHYKKEHTQDEIDSLYEALESVI